MSEKCPCCGAPVKKCRKCGDIEYEPPEYVPMIPYYPYYPSPYYPPYYVGDGPTPIYITYTYGTSKDQ